MTVVALKINRQTTPFRKIYPVWPILEIRRKKH